VRAAVDAAQRVRSVWSGEAPPAALVGIGRGALASALAALVALRAGSPCCRAATQPHACAAEATSAADALALLPAEPSSAGGDAAVTPALAPALAFALLRGGCARCHPRFDLEAVGPCASSPGFCAREGLACLRVLALAGGCHAAPDALLARIVRRSGALLDELAPPPTRHDAAPPLALRGAAEAVRRALAPPPLPPRAPPDGEAAARASEADADEAAAAVLDALDLLCVAVRAAFAGAPPPPHTALVDVDATPLAAATRPPSGATGREGRGDGSRALRARRLRALAAAAAVVRVADAAAVVTLPQKA
jgi:hypothetical protein